MQKTFDELQVESFYINRCPACSHVKGNKQTDHPGQIYQCAACGAIFGQCYLGDSYGIVLPYWDTRSNIVPEQIRYFDLSCLGSKGLERRHGWYAPDTKRIVQTG